MPHRFSLCRERWVVLGLAVLAAVQCAPVLASGDRLGFWDWDLFETLAEAARRSIVEYREFPGWNPWVKGGEPLFSHPLQMFVSPAFIAMLMIGVLPGFKLWILLRAFAALSGSYALGRRLGLGVAASLVIALLFGLSSSYALRVGHGHWNLQAAAYLPWLAFFALRAATPGAWRSRAATAGWLALLFLEGGPYAYVMGALLVVAIAVAELCRRRPGSVPVLALVGLLSLGLSGIKLIPVFEAYGDGQRDSAYAPDGVPDPSARRVFGDFYRTDFPVTAAHHLKTAWISRDQAGTSGLPHVTFNINVGAYFGVLGLACVLAGAIWGGPLGRAALLASLPFLWLVLGAAAPINLWALLHRLPLWSSMAVPSKFTACVSLGFAVAAGAGIHGLARRYANRVVVQRAIPILIGLLALDLLLVSWPIYRYAFPLAPVEIESGSFRQVLLSPYMQDPVSEFTNLPVRPNGKGHALSATYPSVRANIGVLGTYSGQPLKRYAEPDRGTQLGLSQLGGRAGQPPRLLHWSPNTRVVQVDGTRGGWLVLNENHHADWQALTQNGTPLSVAPRGGRLAAKLAPGATEVRFQYRPRAILWGGIVSLISLAICLALGSRPDRATA